MNEKKRSTVTWQSTVLGVDESLLSGAKRMIKKEGVPYFIYASLVYFYLATKRFFTEYIPLSRLLKQSRNGEFVRLVQGNFMILDLNDFGISRELALKGWHEKNSTEYLRTIIKPGMTILEAGANIGYYALIEASLIGEKGYLYAFEPSAFNFNLLKRNLAINNVTNATLEQKAVGAKSGTAKMYISSKSNLSSFIKREDVNHLSEKNMSKVEMVKLDDYLRDKEVDYIRMDIEGYEKEVLMGLEKTFKKKPPRHMFIEVHSQLLHNLDSSAKEVITRLQNFGYEVEKSFYRGRGDIVANSTDELLNHPNLEIGYWETFFTNTRMKG